MRARLSVALLLLAPLTLAAPSAADPASAADTLTFEFDGGTASEYVRTLESVSEELNIVVLTDLSRYRMPAVRLRQAALPAAVGLLDDLTPGTTQARHLVLDHIEGRGTARDVFTIRERASSRTASRSTRVFTLEPAGMATEHVLGAVEIALAQLDGDQPPADLKFHEPTALLICRGGVEQLTAVEQVIAPFLSRIDQAGNRQATEAQRDALVNEVDVLRDQLAMRHQQLAEMDARLQLLTEERQRLADRLDQRLHQSQAEARDAARQQMRLEQELMRLDLELREARDRLNQRESNPGG